ncbi:MAG: lipopolysaccharide biosynthesis protein [Candidatus Electronema sp. VV]
MLNKEKLKNVGLRSITLGTRFFLIFFMAKFLSPMEVGYYGIFTATIGLALYFVGLDFYTYTNREIIKTSNEVRGQLIKGQIALSIILYVIFIPIFLFSLNKLRWEGYLIGWFVPILILEHVNQEVYRLLIVLSHQITASIVLFIRQGVWAVVIVVLMSLEHDYRKLQVVMFTWCISGIFALLIGSRKLYTLNMSGWELKVDWNWIKKGIRISSLFLLATIAIRSVQTIDRYWIEALSSVELVAAYVLFFGVASTLLVFLDAGVFAFAYPLMIEYHQHQKHLKILKEFWRIIIQVLIFSILFAVVSCFLLPYLLNWIDNPVYIKAINWYPLLLMAMIINALSMAPHYALYAIGLDKHIIYSHVIGFFIFIATTWLMSSHVKENSIPIGILCAFIVIFLWKLTAFLYFFYKK